MIQSTLFSLGRRRRRRHRRRRVSSRHWCGVCGTLRRLARECARDAAQPRRLLPEAPQRRHTLARFVNLHRSGRLHILLLLGLGQRRLSWPRRLGNRGLPLAQPASASHACATLCKHLFRWPLACVFGHAAGFFTARWRTRTLPSLLAEELPACTRNAEATCAVKSRAWDWPVRSARFAAKPQRACHLLPNRGASGVSKNGFASSIDARSSRIVSFARVTPSRRAS